MRNVILLSTVFFLGLPACGSGGGGGNDTDSGTDGTDSGTDGSSGGATDSGSGGTTGGGSPLMPCDPLAADPCETGICAGEPSNGFYCRLGCSTMASAGDPCGDGGVCLPSGPLSPDELACFELDDCDFLTGEGCDLAAGDSCVVIDQDRLRTACVPNGSKGDGEPCKPNGIHECGPGLACLGSDLEDGEDGRCTAWCVPGDPLPDGCPACVEITTQIGSCAECSVILDDCPDGEQCQPINEALGGACVGFGPGGDGDPCSPLDPNNSCQEGFVCAELANDVFVCTQKCDPQSPMCDDPEKNCTDIGLIDMNFPTGELGFCVDYGGMLCVPGQMPNGCSMDQVCLPVDMNVGLCSDTCDPTQGEQACVGNYSCLPIDDNLQIFIPPFVSGNGACGTGCTTDADCGGGTCLLTDGIDVDGVCGTTCTPANPTECSMEESCVPTPADPQVGACVPAGDSCDPTDDTACGSIAGTCVALDGMPSNGACMPACFVQDPAACMASGDTCNVKTDPKWHNGACLGQDTPCDPANQTGCSAGSTCSVLGGSAFGGAAFVCGDAGTVPEGGDCSGDPDLCGEGLLCVDITCRAFCDPAADNCAMGTCTDLSANYYLPPNTVGACI